MEAIAIRLEAIASRLEAIRLEAIKGTAHGHSHHTQEMIAWEWDVALGQGLLMVGDSPSNASGLHTLCVRSHVACGNSISSAKDIAFGKAAGVSTALVDADRRHFEEQTGAKQ